MSSSPLSFALGAAAVFAAIVGTGADKAAAIADLNQRVDRRVQDLLDQEHKAQDQYDIATRHGTNHKAQADERQKQIDSLHGK